MARRIYREGTVNRYDGGQYARLSTYELGWKGEKGNICLQVLNIGAESAFRFYDMRGEREGKGGWDRG